MGLIDWFTLAFSAPVFIAAPWVLWSLSGLNRAFRASHAPRSFMRAKIYNGYLAIGVFELSVACALIGFHLDNPSTSTWTNVPALALIGIGFIVASRLRLGERLGMEDERA